MSSRTKILLALAPVLTAFFGAMAYFFVNFDPFRDFLCQTANIGCPPGPEKAEFTVRLTEHFENPYWWKVIVLIVDKDAGTIFSDEPSPSDRKITIDDYTAGNHTYELTIIQYKLQSAAASQYQSTTGGTEIIRQSEWQGDGKITVIDGDSFRIAFEPLYDHEPSLQKE